MHNSAFSLKQTEKGCREIKEVYQNNTYYWSGASVVCELFKGIQLAS